MILIGRMLLLILLLTIIQLINLYFLLAYGPNTIRVIILMNNWLKYLADLLTHLILIRFLVLILIQEKLKLASPTLLVALSLISLIISYFNIAYISALTWLAAQFNMDIVKINFIMIYLTGVAQDWFEIGLNQKD